jgi:hypothetical protein
MTNAPATNPATRLVVFLLGTGAIALIALYLVVLADTSKPGLPAGWAFAVAGVVAWVASHSYDFPERRLRFVYAPAGAGKLIQLGALAALAAALLIVS